MLFRSALLAKTSLEMRADIPGSFEKMHVVVEVELDDGTVLAERCNGPRGRWGTPPIPVDEHLAKVNECLSVTFAPETTARIVDLGGRVDTLSCDEVRELMMLLRDA